MNPSVEDRIASMMRALQDVILPAVQCRPGLAEEQVYLVLGHLQQLADQINLVPRCDRSTSRLLVDLATELVEMASGGPQTLSCVQAVDKAKLYCLEAAPEDARSAIERLGVAVDALIIAAHCDGSTEYRRTLAESVLRHGALSSTLARSWFVATGFEGPAAKLANVETLLN